jgi:hypothetical protein
MAFAEEDDGGILAVLRGVDCELGFDSGRRCGRISGWLLLGSRGNGNNEQYG